MQYWLQWCKSNVTTQDSLIRSNHATTSILVYFQFLWAVGESKINTETTRFWSQDPNWGHAFMLEVNFRMGKS